MNRNELYNILEEIVKMESGIDENLLLEKEEKDLYTALISTGIKFIILGIYKSPTEILESYVKLQLKKGRSLKEVEEQDIDNFIPFILEERERIKKLSSIIEKEKLNEQRTD